MRADKAISIGVFLFAAVLAVSSAFMVGRFGMAFNAYIENLDKLDGEYKVSLKPDTKEKSSWKPKDISTTKIIQGLLWIAFVASIVAAIYVPFAPAAQQSQLVPGATAQGDCSQTGKCTVMNDAPSALSATKGHSRTD